MRLKYKNMAREYRLRFQQWRGSLTGTVHADMVEWQTGSCRMSHLRAYVVTCVGAKHRSQSNASWYCWNHWFGPGRVLATLSSWRIYTPRTYVLAVHIVDSLTPTASAQVKASPGTQVQLRLDRTVFMDIVNPIFISVFFYDGSRLCNQCAVRAVWVTWQVNPLESTDGQFG